MRDKPSSLRRRSPEIRIQSHGIKKKSVTAAVCRLRRKSGGVEFTRSHERRAPQETTGSSSEKRDRKKGCWKCEKEKLKGELQTFRRIDVPIPGVSMYSPTT